MSQDNANPSDGGDRKISTTFFLRHYSNRLLSRKSFLIIALTSAGTVVSGWLAMVVRFIGARVHPPSQRIFILEKWVLPEGGHKVFEKAGVLIKRDERGYYALSLACTHLGCRLEIQGDNTLVCPCHGSLFSHDGTVLTGPATKSLNHYPLELHEEKGLVLDIGRVVTSQSRFLPQEKRKSG